VVSAQTGKRKALSQAIDEAILDAAVSVMISHGPDTLNFSEIARKAGVTTGALYARYENREELLVDIWVQRAGPRLRLLLDLTAQSHSGDEAATKSAAAMLDTEDSLLSAALALMIMSSRVDELAEVIPTELRGWFARNQSWGDSILVLAYALGAAGFNFTLGAPNRHWGWRLAWANALLTPRPVQKTPSAVPKEDDLATILSPNTGDAEKDALLISAARVVARSGLTRATTARIARAADLPQSAYFAHWRTRTEMIAEWAPAVLAGIARSALATGDNAIPRGDAAAAIRGLSEVLSPSYLLTRRLRLEILLAGITDVTVAKAILESDEAAVSAIGGTNEQLRQLAEAVRALVLGLVVLEETMGGISDIDFAAPISAFLEAALTGRS
jgi:AcrR family transcriptional regulator